MLKRIHIWIARSRMRSVLHSLNDRELKDIGINRGDIDRMADELVGA